MASLDALATLLEYNADTVLIEASCSIEANHMQEYRIVRPPPMPE
jgi:hypothetical protein